ncbi:hypothetical protein [Maribacter sp.]|uniref:hypothetical protein n=1 Tax=Maribacter sp. TaxID=1897614 RepID=UPI00329997F1
MKKGLILFFVVTIIQSCGVDMDVLEYADTEPIDDGIDILLLYPENESVINEGINVTQTESRLIFEWSNKSENDYSPYNLHLINSNNNDTIIYESLESESAITLQRDNEYSWFVTGILDSKSSTWSFYFNGPDIDSSSSLAATAISPVNGASISQTSTTVNLIWKSENPDNDVTSHDLYFGEIEDPDIYESDITSSRYNDIPVEAGKIYYWKIVTKDSAGNESTSEVFSFSVG